MKDNKFIEALKANKMAKMGKVVTKQSNHIDYESMSLTELRQLFPDIKSTSQTGFIKKLKEDGILN